MMMNKHQQEQVFVEDNLTNLTSPVSGEASVSNSSSNNNRGEPTCPIYPHQSQYFPHHDEQPPAKKKRNLPGNPDPDAEVIALSPHSLLAKNRFVCEICNKGFQRDQNLQLHRRGHNLPWKLKQRSDKEVVRKKVYVCPEKSCVHNDPSRALGDLTGIKKHFCRKHGEKKWKCDKCSKRYAVQSDWKAHSKVCGTREYRCDCGTLFSRRDSFITHRAFCDALAEETARAITTNPILTNPIGTAPPPLNNSHFINAQQQQQQQQQLLNNQQQQLLNNQQQQQQHRQQQQLDDPLHAFPLKRELHHQPNLMNLPPWLACPPMDQNQHHMNHLPSPPSSSTIFHHDHQSPNMGLGPTYTGSASGGAGSLGGAYHTQTAPSPHMSATALLQKAAEMGATMSKTAQQQQQQHNQCHVSDNTSKTTTTTRTSTTAGLFGLNLSPREHQHEMMSATSTSSGFIVNHGLSCFGNKAATTTTLPTAGGSSDQLTSPSPNPSPGLDPSNPSSYFHDMVVNSLSSPYDHHSDAFGIGSMSSTTTTTTTKKDPSLAFHQTLCSGGAGDPDDGNGGSDGMTTRDFLGLRPLSHNDIFTMAGLGNCITPNNNATVPTSHQLDGHNKAWQGN